MAEPKKYMAGSVPRSFRLMRPGLFPPNCIIGSLVTKGTYDGKGEGTSYVIRDIIMMAQRSFQSVKANASVSLVLSPALRLGGADFTPGFVFTDAREVTVPASEPDPEGFARNYFLKKFGVVDETQEGSETKQESTPHDSSSKESGSNFCNASHEIFSCNNPRQGM